MEQTTQKQPHFMDAIDTMICANSTSFQQNMIQRSRSKAFHCKPMEGLRPEENVLVSSNKDQVKAMAGMKI